MPDPTFRAVALSNHARRGQSPWTWSGSFERLGEASRHCKAEMDADAGR